MKHIFISTSIPYVNAEPHLGHALELVETDILARHEREKGNKVFFTSGTDDNALKNVLKAEEAGESTQDYVSRHATLFKELCTDLQISEDRFIETSRDDDHVRGAQKLWEKAMASGDIYEKQYEGMYCVGCEEFKTVKDLSHNGECPEHPGKAVEVVKEKNYFFRLSKYTKVLKEKIEHDELRIVPEEKKREMLSFIQRGLEDFSISRSYGRARGWGIGVPEDPTQVMYVWFDALSNYINALNYADEGENFLKFWKNADKRIHVVGKGINRFHTIYWPAMLCSAGLPLPTEVFVHGYVTLNGMKMSKSLGNTLNPQTLLREYGSDAVRYFLARHIHPFDDSDISEEKFKEIYNAHLANGLGNLTARILTMAQTHLEERVVLSTGSLSENVSECLCRFRFDEAMNVIFERVKRLDEYIQETLPFKKVKSENTQEVEEGKMIIKRLVHDLFEIGEALSAFMPETSKKITDAVIAQKKPATLFERKL